MYLYIFDLIGVAVFAISGTLAARRSRLDLIGVISAAMVTAVGGGTIRDLLLDRHPIFWLADARYLLVILVTIVGTMLYVRLGRLPGITLEVADALGLALFCVTGAQVAERAGMPALSCVLLGAITGAAGSVIRDVLMAKVPHIFQRGSLYATAALAGAGVYMALEGLVHSRSVATVLGIATAAALRIAAIVWGIKLPEYEVHTAEFHATGSDQNR